MSILRRLFTRRVKQPEPAGEDLNDQTETVRKKRGVHDDISAMLAQTKEKAKWYGGDPFAEYRKSKQLPDTFEYGMNCFLDRCAESSGRAFVQEVYKELKSDPTNLILQLDTSGVDRCPGGLGPTAIPILFIVRFLGVEKAWNKVALEWVSRSYRQEYLREHLIETPKIPFKKPNFFEKLKDETESHYFQRMVALKLGFQSKMLNLLQQGKVLGSDEPTNYCVKLKGYCLLADLFTEQFAREIIKSDQIDRWWVASVYVAKGLPEDGEELESETWSLRLGSFFWHFIWDTILAHHIHSYSGILEESDLNLFIRNCVAVLEIRNLGLLENYADELKKINVSRFVLNKVWNSLAASGTEFEGERALEGIVLPKDLMRMARIATILKVVIGHADDIENIEDLLIGAGENILRLLFDEFSTETVEAVKIADI